MAGADQGRLAISPSHLSESTLPGHPSESIFPSRRSDFQSLRVNMRVDLTESSFRVIPPCHLFGPPFRVIFPSPLQVDLSDDVNGLPFNTLLSAQFMSSLSESPFRVISPGRLSVSTFSCHLSESPLRVDLSGSSFRVISPSDRSESTFSSRFSVPGRPFRVVLPNHVSE